MEWHALFVITGQEEKVKSILEVKFRNSINEYDFVIPKLYKRERRQGVWYEVEKKMLPGYILVRGSLNVKDYDLFKEVPGLLKLLKTDEGFAPIPESEIQILGTLLIGGDVVESSTITFDEGDEVIVIDGPLKGLEAIILSVNKRKGRARIQLDFLGDARTMDVAVNVIEK